MRFLVVMAITAAAAAYGPPRPTDSSASGGSGCGSGCGSATGGSQVVTTHVSPCPGGDCGGSSGSGGASSGDYWWQGQDNPFALPARRPSPGSTSCSGAGCAPGGTPCAGNGCPSSSGPAPGPPPGSVQNLLTPPMGICSVSFVCVNWQLCRNGLVIDDGTGVIDKQRKVIPPRVAATYTSCGGDMICCGVPHRPSQPDATTLLLRPPLPGPSQSPGSGTPSRPHTPVSPPKFSGSGTPASPHTPVSPGTPSRPHTPVSPPKFSGSGTPARPHTPVSPGTPSGTHTPVSPPEFSGSGTPARPHTPVSPGTPARPHTPVSPPKFSGSGTPARPHTPVSSGTPSGPQTPVSPPKFSGSGTPARPHTPVSSGTPARPHTPVSPPKFSGPSTSSSPSKPISPSKPSVPATPARPPKFSGSGTLPRPQTPAQPSSQSPGASPGYGYAGPGTQQSAGPSPLPSTVNQAGPVSPSQPLRPVSNPVGLSSPPSGQAGAMSGGMMGMMGMMPRSGSCSAGTYCVLQDQCNPYTGFIIRGNAQLMAVWPDSPTVPLLPCFVPDGSITNGVCCQEAHPNAGGFD